MQCWFLDVLLDYVLVLRPFDAALHDAVNLDLRLRI